MIFILSGILLHFSAETADMYHDRIIGLVYLLIPYLFKDLVGAEHPAWIGGQR